MSDSVILKYKDKSEALGFVSKFFPDAVSEVILLNGRRGFCWFEFAKYEDDPVLSIYFSFGKDSDISKEWALVLALGICRHTKIEKAGWKCVGFCETMDEFMDCRPFSSDIYLRQGKIEGISLWLRNILKMVDKFSGSSKNLEKLQMEMEQKGIEVFSDIDSA